MLEVAASHDDIRRAVRPVRAVQPAWLSGPPFGRLREQILTLDGAAAARPRTCSLLVDLAARVLPGQGASNDDAEEIIRRAAVSANVDGLDRLRFDSEAGAVGVLCDVEHRETLQALCDLIDQL